MKKVAAVFRKEFRLYFSQPLAYIFIAVFLVAANFIFLQNFFLFAQASMGSFFGFLPWIFLILIPAFSMRLISEEKKLGTIEFILTNPIKDFEFLFGKFLAAVAVLGISLLGAVPVAIGINFFGSPDNGVIFAGFIASLFLAASFISISLFASSLTDNQIIAFVLGILFCFGFLIVGQDFFAAAFGGSVADFFVAIGISEHFDSMARGLFDSRDLIYFGSLISFFSFLTLQVLRKRN